MSTLICCYVHRGEQAWLPIKAASTDGGIHDSGSMVTAVRPSPQPLCIIGTGMLSRHAMLLLSPLPRGILLRYRGNHYKDHTSQRVPMLLERAALSDPQSQNRVAALRSLLLAITVMSLQNPNLPNKNHPSNWRELKLRETSKSRNEEQEVVICEGFFRALFSLANLPRSSQSSCFSSRLSSDALNFTSRCN